MMADVRVLLVIFALPCVVFSCCWSGAEWWNPRYEDQGINYPGGDEMWMSIWSVHTATHWENYYYPSPSYSGRRCSGGCSCDEKKTFTVTGCWETHVKLRNYLLHNLTSESFTSTVENIVVDVIPDLIDVENNTFTDLVNLNELVIHRTSLRQLPDISTTQVVRAMFGYNNIKMFIENHTNPGWPATLTHLNLIDNDIDWVPPGLFCDTNIKYLGLARNKLWFFPTDALCNMPNLEYLSLSENQITSLSEHHLVNLNFGQSPLLHLNLSHNEIFHIEPNALTTMTGLKIIELDYNKFEHIPPEMFHNMSDLIHLSLHHNKLKILHGDTFTEMPSLLTLDLHSQQPGLTNIYYNAFRNINKSLKDLWVSSNDLVSFPHQVLSYQQYDALHSVWADTNRIRDPLMYGSDGFPPKGNTWEARKLTHDLWKTTPNIVRLWLGSNGIPEILNSDFCELTILRELHLNNNLLDEPTTPTDSFSCLAELRILSLASNFFQYMPSAVRQKEHLKKLTHLYMHNNHLTHVEEGALSQLDTLQIVWLHSNHIIAVEDGAFPKENMTEIFLHDNEFKFTHENPFNHMTQLRRLNLGDNQITVIPDVAFDGLDSLTWLELGNNQIARVVKETFKDLPPGNSRLLLNDNDLSYIEDGTLDHFTSFGYLYLDNNKLTHLPRGGDFHDVNIGRSLQLDNNRITRIEEGTFNNVQVTDHILLRNNRISEIETGAFINVRTGDNIYLTSNFLKTLNTGSFMGITSDSIYMNGEEITHIPTGAFQDVNLQHSLYLQDNQIQNIETKAFDISTGHHLYLSNNGLEYIEGQMFEDGSTVGKTLYLDNNNLKALPIDTFVGLTTEHVDLGDNALYKYPQALNVLGLEVIDVADNKITEIQLDDFVGQTNVLELILTGNELRIIPAAAVNELVNLQAIDASLNQLKEIDSAMFEGMWDLESITFEDNNLVYMGAMPNLTSLVDLNLINNNIESLGTGFLDMLNIEVLENVDFDGNPLGCTCQLHNSLSYLPETIQSGECSEPSGNPDLSGTTLDFDSGSSYFTNLGNSLFICSPDNVTALAPDVLVLTVSWSPPRRVAVATPPQNSSAGWEYEVTCSTDLTPSITVTTSELNVTITDADGLVGDTEYVCSVKLILPDGRVSAHSPPDFVMSIKPRVSDNVTVEIDDIVLPINYYDFSVVHPDFNNAPGQPIYSQPSYVPSPYGAWMSISDTPEIDSFSDWYRKIQNNYEFDSAVVLKGISTPEITNRYYDGTFYPIDLSGYGDEGQVDCLGDDHNMGFTGAIRTGIVFTGLENITLGGADDMWLFINRKLIFQVSNTPNNPNMYCKRVMMENAVPNELETTKLIYGGDSSVRGDGGGRGCEVRADSTYTIPEHKSCKNCWHSKGGGILTIEHGLIVGGKCNLVNVSTDPLEQISMDLDVGERYHFNVFMAERYLCQSAFFMETQGTDFILDPIEEPPRDYVVKVDEDLHRGAIVETVFLADTFSAGPPFRVGILRGNEAEHFTILENTALNRIQATAPPPPPLNWVTTEGITYVECDGPAVKIPDANLTLPYEEFVFNTDSMLVVLNTTLDYEVNQFYVVIFQIIDDIKVPALTGQATLKVRVRDINDNCPILAQREFYHYSSPALQATPVVELLATDEDETINQELYFVRGNITEDPLVEYNHTQDLRRYVYELNTNLTFTVIVTDGGTPTRGTTANITVDVHNSCLVDEEFLNIFYDMVIGYRTGTVHLQVPGYFQEHMVCNKTLGVEVGFVPDDWISVSSHAFSSDHGRSRLNMKTLSPELDGLTGGWVSMYQDTNQWIQVDMQEPYIFTKVFLQGRDELPNWVTSLYIWGSDDGVTWTKYNDTLLNGTTDQQTVTELELEPPLHAQYIRLNPQTWVANISLRFELIGCSLEENTYYDESCQRCEASNYCLGDSLYLPCGRCEPPEADSTCGRDPTEHSFGRASECAPCIPGWVCHDGLATPCDAGFYSTCNSTWCPDACTECEPGYSCRGGLKYLCASGTVSDAGQAYCTMCSAGTYQNETGQSVCINCDPGFSSSKSKDRCNPCDVGTFAVGDGSTCKSCSDGSMCPCMTAPGPCFIGPKSFAVCVNTGGGAYNCLDCPPGYDGDGQTCTDIDECTTHSPCWDTTNCTNTEPGYHCSSCPIGYAGSFEDGLGFTVKKRVFEDACSGIHSDVIYQNCTDVNECDYDHGECDPHAFCTNTIGSFICGPCIPGWVGSDLYGCRPGNFCLSGENNCHEHANCIYLGPGQFKCECVNGWAGDGVLCGEDPDQDGIVTVPISCTESGCRRDNCPDVANSGQEDNDGDWQGDVCDPDDDQDTIFDFMDNCPMTWNIGQWDSDNDFIGDACDNCLSMVNTDQADADGDGIGDACDGDPDGDGVTTNDNCPTVPNADQADVDGDNVGEVCDNCPGFSNPAQTDDNENDVGDDCEDRDQDGDGIYNFFDNCATVPNAEQIDTDGDGTGDACDHDIDGDGIHNDDDNCVYFPNPLQEDIDGNQLGDLCELDYDGDGVVNALDNCPNNKDRHATDFVDHRVIVLDPTDGTPDPAWMVLDQGKEVRQAAETNVSSMLIGADYVSSMDYYGTMFAYHDHCYGYMGFVFGYVSHNLYYVVMWKHKHWNWYGTQYKGGIKGIQLKLVDSTSGPSAAMGKSLWYSHDTSSEVDVLWHDPHLTGWECKKAYQWQVKHRPDRGAIRIFIRQEETLLVDSGEIYDTRISGGRLGVFVFAQPGAIFSKLKYECKERENMALKLDGRNDYVLLHDIIDLEVNVSFTFVAWVYLPNNYPLTKMPLLGNLEGNLCMYIENGVLKGHYGSSLAEGSTVIPPWSWTQLVMRYNAEEYELDLFVNGTSSGYEAQVTDTPLVYWGHETMDNLTMLYMGRDYNNYFEGTLDEVRIYGIHIPDSEIEYHWQNAGLALEEHKRYLMLHYNMDNNPDDIYTTADDENLEDKSWRLWNGTMSGKPKFKASHLDESRFSLQYPTNRRRRRSIRSTPSRHQDHHLAPQESDLLDPRRIDEDLISPEEERRQSRAAGYMDIVKTFQTNPLFEDMDPFETQSRTQGRRYHEEL